MNKSIYDEALLDLRMNDSMRVTGQHVLTREQYSNVFKALEQAQKQKKLLELYRQLVKDLGLVIEHDTTDTWDGPEDYEYLEINYDSIKSLNTYKQIEELENDK